MNAEAAHLNSVTSQIISAAIAVHRTLGPGLLESAYEACLFYKLVTQGLLVERQKPLPLAYEGVTLRCSYRMDLVVAGSVIVEVKSVKKLDRVHEAPMLSCLKISGLRVGLMLNFNVKNISQQGVMRRVNNFPE
jgi:GxxExxY protein